MKLRKQQPAPAALQEQPLPNEPATLVRLRAAASAVGVSEDELLRRIREAGLSLHQVTRGGELTQAVDLDDVWRLVGSAKPPPALPVVEPAVAEPIAEFASLSARIERELEEERQVRVRAETAYVDAERDLAGLRLQLELRERELGQALETSRTLARGLEQDAATARAEINSQRTQMTAALENALAARRTAERELEALQTARTEEGRKLALANERCAQLESAQQVAAGALENERARMREEQAQLGRQVVGEREAAEKLRGELAAARAATTAAAAELQSTRASHAEERKQRQDALERCKQLEERNASLQQEAAKAAKVIEDERSRAKLDLGKLAQELQTERQASEGLRGELAGERKSLAARTRELEALRTTHAEESRQHQSAVERVKKLEQQLATSASAAAKTLEDERTRAKRERGELEREVQGVKETLERLRESVAAERASFGAQAGELERLEAQLAKIAIERDHQKAHIRELEARVVALQETERALQRYADRKELQLREVRNRSAEPLRP
jgi:chromosome segregation ATPase